MALTTLGLILLALINHHTTILFVVISLMVLGFGFAMFSSPNMNAIMSSVAKKYYGIASGSVGTMRLLGQMVSMGIATLVIALFIGRAQITPDSFPLLIKSVKIAFTIFSCLCAIGIYFSFSRGDLRSGDCMSGRY
jgi:MFS family permease